MRVGPRPGTSSSTDFVIFLSRSWRWYVIAKRCASSRTCCSRYSASESRGMRTGLGVAGQVHLFEPLGEARDADVLEPELLEHAHRDVELALAAVDQQQVRRVREPLARVRTFVALAQVVAEPAGQHLFHRREVVLALRASSP